MKPPIIAALLSGLVFPGLGQLLVLKRRKRAVVFMLPALAAFIWLLNNFSKGADALMGEALNGTLPADPAIIAARLGEAGSAGGYSAASFIIFICWAASLIDALLIKDNP